MSKNANLGKLSNEDLVERAAAHLKELNARLGASVYMGVSFGEYVQADMYQVNIAGNAVAHQNPVIALHHSMTQRSQAAA